MVEHSPEILASEEKTTATTIYYVIEITAVEINSDLHLKGTCFLRRRFYPTSINEEVLTKARSQGFCL